MVHSTNISQGYSIGQRRKAKKGPRSKNRENIILRLSASLARALEGEFNLY